MNNLAYSYSALERHDEALEMREKTLEFYRRVLPENHPDIGEGDAYDKFLFSYLPRHVVIQRQPQLRASR